MQIDFVKYSQYYSLFSFQLTDVFLKISYVIETVLVTKIGYLFIFSRDK